MSVEQAFGALADTTRMALVTRLAHGPASVTELASPYSMSLRGVLKHIQVLEDAGVVRTTKVGRVRRCELRGDRMAEMAKWLGDVTGLWNRRLDRLEAFLDREGQDDH